MRCTCCNRALSDYESTLRHAVTDEFLDTCNTCLEGTGVPVKARKDLEKSSVLEDDEFEFDDLSDIYEDEE